MDIPLDKPIGKMQSPDDFFRASCAFSSRDAIFGFDFRRKQTLSTCRRLVRVSMWLLALGGVTEGRAEGEIGANELSIAHCSNCGSDVEKVVEDRISTGD